MILNCPVGVSRDLCEIILMTVHVGSIRIQVYTKLTKNAEEQINLL